MDIKANDAMTHFDLVQAAKQKVHGLPTPVDPVVKYESSYPVDSQMGIVPTKQVTPKAGPAKIPHEIKCPIRPLGA